MKKIIFANQTQKKASGFLFFFDNTNKALGYLRNTIVTWVVGFGMLSDLYFLVLSVVSALSSLIVGALNSTFIPYSQKLNFNGKRKLLGGSVLISSFVYFVIASVSAWVILLNSSPDLQSEALSNVGLVLVIGLIVGFACMLNIQLIDEFFKSRKNFVFGGLLLVIVNFTSVIFFYYGGSITPLFFGFSLAAPSFLAVFYVFFVVRLPRWNIRLAIPYLQHTLPLVLSGSAGMMNVFIDRWYAGGLESGRLSLMQTSLILVTQVGGALISPLINSAYPYFASHFSKSEFSDGNYIVHRVEDKVLALMFIFVIFFVLFGEWGVSIIYQHGAVESGTVVKLYESAFWYLPVFIYGSLVTLYLRILYCLGEVRMPALLSAGVIILNIIINISFFDLYDWRALAGSASFCAWLYFLLISLVLFRKKNYRLRLSRFLASNIPFFVIVWAFVL